MEIPTTISIQMITEIEIKGNGQRGGDRHGDPVGVGRPDGAHRASAARSRPLPTATATITPLTGTTQLILTAKNVHAQG